MKQLTIAGMALFVITGSSFASPGREKEAEFFSGVLLLQSASALTSEQKAEKYKELQVMTGITTAGAKALLNDYREKPKEWQILYNAMTKLLTAPLTPDNEPTNHR